MLVGWRHFPVGRLADCGIPGHPQVILRQIKPTGTRHRQVLAHVSLSVKGIAMFSMTKLDKVMVPSSRSPSLTKHRRASLGTRPDGGSNPVGFGLTLDQCVSWFARPQSASHVNVKFTSSSPFLLPLRQLSPRKLCLSYCHHVSVTRDPQFCLPAIICEEQIKVLCKV